MSAVAESLCCSRNAISLELETCGQLGVPVSKGIVQLSDPRMVLLLFGSREDQLSTGAEYRTQASLILGVSKVCTL